MADVWEKLKSDRLTVARALSKGGAAKATIEVTSRRLGFGCAISRGGGFSEMKEGVCALPGDMVFSSTSTSCTSGSVPSGCMVSCRESKPCGNEAVAGADAGLEAANDGGLRWRSTTSARCCQVAPLLDFTQLSFI